MAKLSRRDLSTRGSHDGPRTQSDEWPEFLEPTDKASYPQSLHSISSFSSSLPNHEYIKKTSKVLRKIELFRSMMLDCCLSNISLRRKKERKFYLSKLADSMNIHRAYIEYVQLMPLISYDDCVICKMLHLSSCMLATICLFSTLDIWNVYETCVRNFNTHIINKTYNKTILNFFIIKSTKKREVLIVINYSDKI